MCRLAERLMIRCWNWGGIPVEAPPSLSPSLLPPPAAVSLLLGTSLTSPPLPLSSSQSFPSSPTAHRCQRRCGGVDVRLPIHLSHRQQRVALESEIHATTAGHFAFVFSDVPAARGDSLVQLLSFLSIKLLKKRYSIVRRFTATCNNVCPQIALADNFPVKKASFIVQT